MKIRKSVLIAVFISSIFTGCSFLGNEQNSVNTAQSAEIHPAAAAGSFTIVTIPDTQNMSAGIYGGTAAMFSGEVKWIINSSSSLNTVFVADLGDIVNTCTKTSEWINATNALNQLDGVLPYGVAAGNHDANVMYTDNYAIFDSYYPVSRFTKYNWFGGCYNNTDEGNYELITASGMDFILVHIRWGTNTSILSWASGVLDQYPNRRAVVVTHEYLDLTAKDSVGTTIWNKVVKAHDNVFMVLCGHCHGENKTVSTNNYGHPVYELLSDYQDDNPQTGRLRYYTFNPANNTVNAFTYSTYLNQYYTADSNQFTFNYQMSAASSSASSLVSSSKSAVSSASSTSSSKSSSSSIIASSSSSTSGGSTWLENLDDFPSSAGVYSDGTFAGTKVATWTYSQCRGDIIINGKTPCLGKDRSPNAQLLSSVTTGGIQTLSFDYMQAFSTTVNFDVTVNSTVVTNIKASASELNVVKHIGPFNVNVNGSFTLKFVQNSGGGQVCIDNIQWLSY